MVFSEALVKKFPAFFEYECLLPCSLRSAIGTSSEIMWHGISPTGPCHEAFQMLAFYGYGKINRNTTHFRLFVAA
jgi:hypothetical protein